MWKDEVDEIIDGLPVSELYQEDQPGPWKIPRVLVICVPLGMFMLGAIFGLSQLPGESSTSDRPTPVITKTVTETATQPAVPPSCARAIAIMARMMEANSTIAGAGEEQLDIAHMARQAIFLKDWKMLDKAMNLQTELNNRLDKPNAQAIAIYPELKDALKECLDATS